MRCTCVCVYVWWLRSNQNVKYIVYNLVDKTSTRNNYLKTLETMKDESKNFFFLQWPFKINQFEWENMMDSFSSD